MANVYISAATAIPPDFALDAFGRLRVSEPFTIFDNQNQYNDNTLVWENSTTGSATVTHSANESAVKLNTTTTSGDKVIRQTRQYFRYQPGKSQQILMTAVLGTTKTNVRKRIGYFDVDGGMFFEDNGSTFRVVIRTKTSGVVVDNVINQVNWNIDTLDGTGTSKINLDLSKSQIFFIDFQWLGVGRVRFGFVIEGRLILVHQSLNANVLNTVYTSTANLPIRYEIENTGIAASSSSLTQICVSVMSEGGFEKIGFVRAKSNATTGSSITSRQAILSIRPKTTFNSITNRSTILPTSVDLLATTNNIFYEIIYSSSLGGSPNWVSVGANSFVEYDTSGTTVTGGEVIDCGFVVAGTKQAPIISSSNDFFSKIPLSLNIAGDTAQILTVVATPFTGTAVVNAAISWREIF
jgi:hypothetical protein